MARYEPDSYSVILLTVGKGAGYLIDHLVEHAFGASLPREVAEHCVRRVPTVLFIEKTADGARRIIRGLEECGHTAMMVLEYPRSMDYLGDAHGSIAAVAALHGVAAGLAPTTVVLPAAAPAGALPASPEVPSLPAGPTEYPRLAIGEE